MIKIYCDGSAKGNGMATSLGGAGVCALIFNDENDESDFRIDYIWKSREYGTTNNREEMKALIHAIDLATTKYKDEICIIYSDSTYCVNMCRDWIWNWVKRDWTNSSKKIVENLDLVKELYQRLTDKDFPNYQIAKCSGHNNIIGNELADALATSNQTKLNKIFKENDYILNIKMILTYNKNYDIILIDKIMKGEILWIINFIIKTRSKVYHH